MLERLRSALAGAPVVRAWQLAFTGRERGARALFGVILVYAGVALGTLFSARVQRAVMASSHFRPVSIGAWIALQPAPKMYGIANRVWTRTLPFTPSARGDDPFERSSVWVNHYPARYARFDGERRNTPLPRWVTIRSRYGDTTLWTSIEVTSTDGRLFLSPRELAP